MKRVFRTEVKVYYADTDAMGVVYHTNYIRWFEIGRTQGLRELGFPYSEIEKIPVWMPLASAHCEYKRPARYEDVLEIISCVAEVGHASLMMSYEIINKKTGELLVTGYTRHGITDEKLKPLAFKKACPEVYAALKGASEELPEDASPEER